eukprot:TRINITY_DN468_c0_g1_i1.p1 TRINITY_DN468_c0_g1~~TRINITY_DN468_c0_g1_i1.p1  ORF type:complete len:658 (-),score=61.57 TRINITY_DN468_c0_g1_i1:6019-7992(-)
MQIRKYYPQKIRQKNMEKALPNLVVHLKEYEAITPYKEYFIIDAKTLSTSDSDAEKSVAILLYQCLDKVMLSKGERSETNVYYQISPYTPVVLQDGTEFLLHSYSCIIKLGQEVATIYYYADPSDGKLCTYNWSYKSKPRLRLTRKSGDLPTEDLTINSGSVSNNHAELYYDSEKKSIMLKDNFSTYGTFIKLEDASVNLRVDKPVKIWIGKKDYLTISPSYFKPIGQCLDKLYSYAVKKATGVDMPVQCKDGSNSSYKLVDLKPVCERLVDKGYKVREILEKVMLYLPCTELVEKQKIVEKEFGIEVEISKECIARKLKCLYQVLNSTETDTNNNDNVWIYLFSTQLNEPLVVSDKRPEILRDFIRKAYKYLKRKVYFLNNTKNIKDLPPWMIEKLVSCGISPKTSPVHEAMVSNLKAMCRCLTESNIKSLHIYPDTCQDYFTKIKKLAVENIAKENILKEPRLITYNATVAENKIALSKLRSAMEAAIRIENCNSIEKHDPKEALINYYILLRDPNKAVDIKDAKNFVKEWVMPLKTYFDTYDKIDSTMKTLEENEAKLKAVIESKSEIDLAMKMFEFYNVLEEFDKTTNPKVIGKFMKSLCEAAAKFLEELESPTSLDKERRLIILFVDKVIECCWKLFGFVKPKKEVQYTNSR